MIRHGNRYIGHFIACAGFVFLLCYPVVVRHYSAGQFAQQDEVVLGWRNTTRQTRQNSCGPALLSSISRNFGDPITEYALISWARMTTDGITLGEYSRLAGVLNHGGIWLNFGTRPSSLPPLPTVLHLKEPAGHFVLIMASTEALVIISDPSNGLMAIPTRRIVNRWSGFSYALQL